MHNGGTRGQSDLSKRDGERKDDFTKKIHIATYARAILGSPFDTLIHLKIFENPSNSKCPLRGNDDFCGIQVVIYKNSAASFRKYYNIYVQHSR